MTAIKEFTKEYFLSRDADKLLTADNLLAFNYIEDDFFTSIDFMEMISNFEQQFSITFSDEQLQSREFMTVGGLIHIVEQLHVQACDLAKG